jgi:hypothetical protein
MISLSGSLAIARKNLEIASFPPSFHEEFGFIG